MSAESLPSEPDEKYAPQTSTHLKHIDGIPPWRYRCPDCKTPAVVRRAKLGNPKEHSEYEPHGYAHDVPTNAEIADYRCDYCGERFNHPYDGKHGEQRQVEELQP